MHSSLFLILYCWVSVVLLSFFVFTLMSETDLQCYFIRLFLPGFWYQNHANLTKWIGDFFLFVSYYLSLRVYLPDCLPKLVEKPPGTGIFFERIFLNYGFDLLNQFKTVHLFYFFLINCILKEFFQPITFRNVMARRY